MTNHALPAIDLDLARRLERAEATANSAFVDAHAVIDPSVGAVWIDVAGTYAMFDGVGSPLTQTFGLGLFDSFLEREFDTVEAFFDTRGASTCHEVSSLAPDATQRLLSARGYEVIERSTVLLRSTHPDDLPVTDGVVVRVTTEDERQMWTRTCGQGWSSEGPELAGFVEAFGGITTRARGVHPFVAELDSQPIATGALHVSDGIALLAGASTIPSARRRGAQQALLRARLAFAAARGIELAMVVTQPGSASQRNAERQGFVPVYTRAKWQLNGTHHS